MKIGVLSGDLYEWRSDRTGVSVPDYAVQGFLVDKLCQRGHEVVLLTRTANAGFDYLMLRTQESGRWVDYRVGADPSGYGMDVLFVDRLGKHGSEFDTAMWQVDKYRGPVVYNSYIPYPGWNPPFGKHPDMLLDGKRWTILNRATVPNQAHNAMCGREELVSEELQRSGRVGFAQWMPFFMLEYPWRLPSVEFLNKPSGMRRWKQGYMGRVPRADRRRSRMVKAYMSAQGWSKVAYGPMASTKWLSEETGCDDGGRIEHRDIPKALETFDMTVQVAIDRFAGRGHLGYIPHRLIECALAGVLQLVDPAMGIRELTDWEVRTEIDLRRWAALPPEDVAWGVEEQRRRLLPLADPQKVMDDFVGHLEAAAA